MRWVNEQYQGRRDLRHCTLSNPDLMRWVNEPKITSIYVFVDAQLSNPDLMRWVNEPKKFLIPSPTPEILSNPDLMRWVNELSLQSGTLFLKDNFSQIPTS